MSARILIVDDSPTVTATMEWLLADAGYSVAVAKDGLEALAKIRKLETRRNVAPNSVAKLMSVIMFERRYFPLLTQVIVGGIDSKPEIYTLDPLGSVLPDDYAAVGTGAEMALGIMDAEFKPNMTEEKARELAVRAIRSAIQRDAASGDGIDVLFVTKGGPREEMIPIRTV